VECGDDRNAAVARDLGQVERQVEQIVNVQHVGLDDVEHLGESSSERRRRMALGEA
jgi:hypothetical protein